MTTENLCLSSLQISNPNAEKFVFHCGGSEGHPGLHFSLGSAVSADTKKRQDYIMSWSNSEGPTTISAAEEIFRKIQDEGLAELSSTATQQDPSLPESSPVPSADR
jgi:hypothetical protein